MTEEVDWCYTSSAYASSGGMYPNGYCVYRFNDGEFHLVACHCIANNYACDRSQLPEILDENGNVLDNRYDGETMKTACIIPPSS